VGQLKASRCCKLEKADTGGKEPTAKNFLDDEDQRRFFVGN
jgi:hypothetical protein